MKQAADGNKPGGPGGAPGGPRPGGHGGPGAMNAFFDSISPSKFTFCSQDRAEPVIVESIAANPLIDLRFNTEFSSFQQVEIIKGFLPC